MKKSAKPKICLTVAGLDPSGGAGIVADVKTFAAFGCFAAAAVTSLTFQNTVGVFGAAHQTAETVCRQIEPILDDYEIAAVKTGMLPTAEIIETVARLIKENNLVNLVVDPVVRSTSGYDLIDSQALKSLILNLFPLAELVTPNIPEAERIAEIPIENAADIERAAKIIQNFGARNVLIKGGHSFDIQDSRFKIQDSENQKRLAQDYLFVSDERRVFEAEYIETTATHGTGCVLSAAIAANLALGKSLTESVAAAKNFVTQAISGAPQIGKGNSPIGI